MFTNERFREFAIFTTFFLIKRKLSLTSDGKMAILKQGQQLKALIEQSGFTLTNLAPKIGYTREHLSKRLSSNKIDELLVWKISQALGIDLVPVIFPEEKSHEKEKSCEDEISRLRAELEAAQRTISDL